MRVYLLDSGSRIRIKLREYHGLEHLLLNLIFFTSLIYMDPGRSEYATINEENNCLQQFTNMVALL